MNSFDDLATRLRAGKQDAATEVFERFAHRLIGLARARLDHHVKSKVGPEDVMQSVFRSFFSRQADGRLDLRDWQSLWSLLVLMTMRKCQRKSVHYRRQSRDVRKEVNIQQEEESSDLDWLATGREPSPDEAVQLADTVNEWLKDMSERDRQIVLMRLQGCTVGEISAELLRSERTVERALERARHLLDDHWKR